MWGRAGMLRRPVARISPSLVRQSSRNRPATAPQSRAIVPQSPRNRAAVASPLPASHPAIAPRAPGRSREAVSVSRRRICGVGPGNLSGRSRAAWGGTCGGYCLSFKLAASAYRAPASPPICLAQSEEVGVVERVQLRDDEEPAEDRHLLIQWKPGEGMRTEHFSGRMVQFVPEHLWRFWQTEGPELASKVGLTKVYYRGRPHA